MSEKQYVTYGQSCGCGGTDEAKKITGCRFSLSVMSDRYADIILGALAKVDTGKVWKMTDKLSTVYRGRQLHVEDAVMACFVHAFRPDVHMTLEATFSKGCPGDVDADRFMAEDDVPLNAAGMADIHFPVACKIALYPMGVPDYMRHIAAVVNHAIDLGLYERSSHYCTILSGDIHALFGYFHYVNTYCGENLSHYVFEVTLSVNSPTV
ncbi:MAG: hypothetical protein IJ702_02045 [Fretibacterium sp.]|nr:hypothetical protein [Fretibacterium sp.]